MAGRVRYLLVGGVALVTAIGLIGWHFWGRGIEARRRANRDRDGFRAGLSARSARLRVATSEILDAITHDDGLHGQGRGAEHALRNPCQRVNAVSPRRHRSRLLSDTRL